MTAFVVAAVDDSVGCLFCRSSRTLLDLFCPGRTHLMPMRTDQAYVAPGLKRLCSGIGSRDAVGEIMRLAEKDNLFYRLVYQANQRRSLKKRAYFVLVGLAVFWI